MAKETKKVVRSSQRDIDKEIRDLDKTEKQLLLDIKTRAKVASGNDDRVLRTLASQLVTVRSQREKMISAKSHVGSMGLKAQAMKTQVAMAGAMKNVGGAMAAANKAIDMTAINKTMSEFQKASMTMDIQEELMDDALCDAFDGDGVEEEADEITNQVLAELGLALDGQMADVATSKLPERAAAVREQEGEDLPDLAARLKAL